MKLGRWSRRERPPAPVKVAWARNLAEAELIEGLLDSEGIPCLIQRTAAADVPDFLAAGPRKPMFPSTISPAIRTAIASGAPAETPAKMPS
ncbi:MAG: hypothetical protein ACKORA_07295, partial [Solirubrobacterales bacterium]